MLSYKSFLIMIKEGLILSHDLQKCKNSLEFNFSKLNIWMNIEYNYENKTFNVEFERCLNENELKYISHISNVLGYFLSYYKVYSKNKISTKTFPWINIENYILETKNRGKVVFNFEARFDEQLNYIPKKLWHCTLDSNFEKIKKNGLIPKYKEKGDFRPDRIYFSLSLKDCLEIKKINIYHDSFKNINNNYFILEIDTKEINNLQLFKDPRSNGVYTYNHINPKNIKIIELF